MKIPQELYSAQFDKSRAFGYKTEEVDKYVSRAQAVINELAEENQLLTEKLETLGRELTRYKDDEDSLKAALIGAQKLGDSILKDSRTQAAVLLSEATGKADILTTDAKKEAARIVKEAADKGDVLLEEALAKHDAVLGELETKLKREKQELITAKEETARFKSTLAAMYMRHLKMVAELPGEITELPEAEATGTLAQDKPKEAKTASKPSKEAREPKESRAPEAGSQQSEAPPQEQQLGMEDFMPAQAASAQAKKPEPKKQPKSDHSRFGKLYFGEDYDISQDE